MRDWLHSTIEEINAMSFDEAVEIVERQIELGHSEGDYKPRPHMTKALDIILQTAKMQFELYQKNYNSGIIIHLQNERGKRLAKIEFQNNHMFIENDSCILDNVDGDKIDGVYYEVYRVILPIEYNALENVSNEHLLEELKERMSE